MSARSLKVPDSTALRTLDMKSAREKKSCAFACAGSPRPDESARFSENYASSGGRPLKGSCRRPESPARA